MPAFGDKPMTLETVWTADEAFLEDGLAVAADLAVGLEEELVLVAEEGRGGEAADAGADDEVTDGIHWGVGQ
jgi:hypothetical protein